MSSQQHEAGHGPLRTRPPEDQAGLSSQGSHQHLRVLVSSYVKDTTTYRGRGPAGGALTGGKELELVTMKDKGGGGLAWVQTNSYKPYRGVSGVWPCLKDPECLFLEAQKCWEISNG